MMKLTKEEKIRTLQYFTDMIYETYDSGELDKASSEYNREIAKHYEKLKQMLKELEENTTIMNKNEVETLLKNIRKEAKTVGLFKDKERNNFYRGAELMLNKVLKVIK